MRHPALHAGAIIIDVTDVNGDLTLVYDDSGFNMQNLQINFSDNSAILDLIWNILRPFIETAIREAFNTNFPSVVQAVVTTLDGVLDKVPTAVPLPLPAPYNIAEIRYCLTGNPVSDSGYMGIMMEGDIVPLAYPAGAMPPVPPPSIPAFNAASSQYYLEAQITPYTLLSAVWTYWNAGAL